MTKINPDRLKVTYAAQGRGVYSNERSQKDVDIWQIDETDAEENAVINDIAQEVYEQELSSARVLDFVEDFGLGYSAATAVTTIVKVCGTLKDDRHYADKIEDLDRAIEHIERIQARIMRAAEAVR